MKANLRSACSVDRTSGCQAKALLMPGDLRAARFQVLKVFGGQSVANGQTFGRAAFWETPPRGWLVFLFFTILKCAPMCCAHVRLRVQQVAAMAQRHSCHSLSLKISRAVDFGVHAKQRFRLSDGSLGPPVVPVHPFRRVPLLQ